MRNEKLRPGRTADTPARAASRHPLAGTLAVLATVVTIATVALSLIGYGVTLAVENVFSIPHSQLFNSSTDLLGLSTWVLIRAFPVNWLDVLLLLNKHIWPMAVLTGFALVVTCLLISRDDLWPGKKWNAALRKKNTEERRRLLRLFSPVVGLWGGVSFYLCVAAIGLATYVAICTISVFPVIGAAYGEDYLREHVVEPERCYQSESRETRLKAYEAKKNKSGAGTKKLPFGASCVQVFKDGKQIAQGRVAISTTGYLVLFDPDSGRVQRIPTRDAIVEPVGTLQTVADN